MRTLFICVVAGLFRGSGSLLIRANSDRADEDQAIDTRYGCFYREYDMTKFTKLNFKSVTRSTLRDPVIVRREKLVAGLKQQLLVHAAALKGEAHRVERTTWIKNEYGERVAVPAQRRVRPWFFEQDAGWYVQCRYGARVITMDGKNNAVFVSSLAEVGAVLDVFIAATQAGELDTALARVVRRTLKLKPGAARAAAND